MLVLYLAILVCLIIDLLKKRNDKLKVTIKVGENATMIRKGSFGSAGYDIFPNCSGIIGAGDRATISTGIKMHLSKGWYARIAPRSGLSNKYGINVLAGVGDSDYVGDVFVILHNTGKTAFPYDKTNAIAQVIFTQCFDPVFTFNEMPKTDRGVNCLGSTDRN